ncbi:AMP-binding protein [Mycobacterium sp. 852013-51886_SCH5428379]|uniref:AMP-binding protein n=1 Tax=Mycobacterium sp. 852013-51886_SCH5428379 TaxID=1834111 RepID=UPI000A7A6985|nr:AMP-binding protein [Mycobacterium sp. 852013-51886_SCH5428379]
MATLIDHLAAFGDRPAIIAPEVELTYRQLADRVAATAEALGPRRRLVLIETRNEIGTLVPYLATLAGRHVALPVPPDRHADAIVATYRPDATVSRDGDIVVLGEPTARLHDDLALLLSTSGSTGSPKLVRLSRDNLLSNTEAIASYLSIDENDCAPTTLPMSYCYGLSVVHSHLLRGARLLLSDRSVIDPRFWELFVQHRATSLAGVPYTFDLLDRTGFDTMSLPDLRYVTQAGGRLAPDRVRRFADLGAARGWDLFVMYGATEATARMAYLPPHRARTDPTSIGRPIPGGEFDVAPIDGWADPGVGELVYRGPNVMLGYAQQRDDLALGRSVTELRTGDVGRRRPDGLYEVIGRRDRFVKLFGLRVDLQRVEALLRQADVHTQCTHDGRRLLVAVAGSPTTAPDAARVRALAAEAAGVPADAVTVVPVDELPMLPSGKPDHAAVRAAAAAAEPSEPSDTDIRRLFADVLHLDPGQIRPDATFTALGGTSLNYVTMSVRLQSLLGRLPSGWPDVPVADLERQTATAAAPSSRLLSGTVETSVLLRALAIVLIVGSHAELFELWGGAHVLLAVAGYNFARFGLFAGPRPERIRRLRTTIAWIALPSIAWIALVMTFSDDYHASNLLLANKILGPHDSMTAGRLWFIEVLVYTLIALTLLCAIPAVDRWERRAPFVFAAVFLAGGVALRYDVLGLELGQQAWFTYTALWFFAAGWAAARARTTVERAVVSAVMVVCLTGYFGDGVREMLVLTGVLLLIWLPALRCPRWTVAAAGVLAEASLYTYLTHFQVYPLFEGHPLVGVTCALAVGVLLSSVIAGLRRRRAAGTGLALTPLRSPRAHRDRGRRRGRQTDVDQRTAGGVRGRRQVGGDAGVSPLPPVDHR